jgi:D-xylose transport system permease protein
MVLVLAALWIALRLKLGPFYWGGESIANLSRAMATWTILAAGMTLVIVCGHIDLSVGSLLALTASVAAFLMSKEFGRGWPAAPAVAAALGTGLAIGLAQGGLVAYARVPAFIVTLAGMFIYRGLTFKISEREPRVAGEPWIAKLGRGHVDPAVGWAVAIGAVVLIAAWAAFSRARRRRLGLTPEGPALPELPALLTAAAFLFYVQRVNAYQGIPTQTLLMAAILAALGFVARHTRFGRHVYAVGGNAEAARLSGISVERTTVAVFGIMGLMAAVGGVVWMAQNNGSTQNAGEWYELYAIAACVIGGTSLLGGRGGVFGAFLGALVMATVVQGLDYATSESWVRSVVYGAVLLAAVVADVVTHRRA